VTQPAETDPPELESDLSHVPDPFAPPKGRGKRSGPKPRIITPKFVYDCARLFLTQEEIGCLCGLSASQVSSRLNDEDHPELKEAYISGRNTAVMSLRRAQFKAAVEKGNITAQIWLGKQELGQADKREETSDVNVNVNVQYIAAWGKTPAELPSPPANQDLPALDDHDVIDSTATDADDLPDPPASPD
jgi:hypothetical protein